jgi:hypothetical protein
MSEVEESVAAKAAEAIGTPAETTPAPSPEVVPSPEVKVDPKPADVPSERLGEQKPAEDKIV